MEFENELLPVSQRERKTSNIKGNNAEEAIDCAERTN